VEHARERDMVELLIDDHREVESTFHELEADHGTPDERRRLAGVVVAELVRHSVAEEAYLYPTARRHLDDGDREAGHAAAERTMNELEDVEATNPRFEELLAVLIRDVRRHISDEENGLFPKLRQACARTELMDLGRKVERIKALAPTRPHPSAGDL